MLSSCVSGASTMVSRVVRFDGPRGKSLYAAYALEIRPLPRFSLEPKLTLGGSFLQRDSRGGWWEFLSSDRFNSACAWENNGRRWYDPLPTKPRPEDMFIEAFLSAYEDLTWADADKDWFDRRIDGAVEMLATRKSDRKTLAIEHTVIEPFVKEKEDFAFFQQAFLKIEDDKSLVVPDRWIQVFIPAGTLHGHRKAAAREVIVKVVHEWIRANRLNLRDGEHDYLCAVAGVPGTADFEIKLTIKDTPLAKHGQLNVRRQQVGNDFGDVVKKALCKKLPKLARQKADKHVLILERQHITSAQSKCSMRLPSRVLPSCRCQR